jgi:hypothetical protein
MQAQRSVMVNVHQGSLKTKTLRTVTFARLVNSSTMEKVDLTANVRSVNRDRLQTKLRHKVLPSAMNALPDNIRKNPHNTHAPHVEQAR